MQWASLWPSSVIKTGVSLVAQSALFCHPTQALPVQFPSPCSCTRTFSAFVCSLGLLGVLYHARSSLLLFFLFALSTGLRAPFQHTPLLALWIIPYCALLTGLLRTFSTDILHFPTSRSLFPVGQRCKVYLNLFPIFLIYFSTTASTREDPGRSSQIVQI